MRFGKPLYQYETVDSTQDIARALAAKGEPYGAVVSTAYQTRGRGRYGRTWFAPSGANVCMTVIGPPVPAEHAWQVALLSGVAIAEGVQLVAGVNCKVRFPNDVYLDGLKMAGVLIEALPAPGKPGFVLPLIGIGINVNVPADAFPDDLRLTATSLLRATGREHPVNVIRTAVLSRIEANWEAWEAGSLNDTILPRWRELVDLRAFRTYVLDGVSTPARVVYLCSDGTLTLELEDHTRRQVSAPQVVLGE